MVVLASLAVGIDEKSENGYATMEREGSHKHVSFVLWLVRLWAPIRRMENERWPIGTMLR